MLLFALALTLYANAVRSDVPRWGAEAERAWDAQLAEAFGRLSHDMAGGIGRAEAVRTIFPASPIPKALDVPILGRTEPFRAGGALTFRDDCYEGGVWLNATHDDTLSAAAVDDIVSSVCGRLAFTLSPSYSPPFAYRVEFGGLLRVQGDSAVVVAGPLLDLKATDDDPSTGFYEVSITMPDLYGAGTTAALDRSSVAVVLAPGPATPELAVERNAAWIQLDFHTPFAEAWEKWFDERLELAEFEDYTVTADSDSVSVTINGPRTDDEEADLIYSLSYGLFKVTIE